MPRTKISEYRSYTDDQIRLALQDLELSVFRIRMLSASDRAESPMEIRNYRKEIARLLTIIRERELLAEAKAMEEEKLAAKAATENTQASKIASKTVSKSTAVKATSNALAKSAKETTTKVSTPAKSSSKSTKK